MELDRYQLASEFHKVKMSDQIKRIDNLEDMREVALGLWELNYRLRTVINHRVKAEVPKTEHMPPSVQ